MDMYVNGQWRGAAKRMSIVAPYAGDVVDTVPLATADDAREALAAAVDGARAMAALTAYQRTQILHRAADLLAAHVEELAVTISREQGKPLSESRGETSRMPDFLRLCAFEGAQMRGETLPLDAHIGAQGKLGLTLRQPCGIVVAITPFNYPLLLVLHKVGPALAAGNAVILKPATPTPLTALKLTRLMLAAGLPANGLQCLTGDGPLLGGVLCADERVRKISFTGSTAVGEQITRIAGVKRLSLELGSNAPLVVLADADVEAVAAATAVGGYVNAGQVCISIQRVLVQRQLYGDYLDALRPRVEAILVGDPLADGTQLSAMTSEKEAQRVVAWVREAEAGGARVVTGGERSGAVVAPTIVADVRPEMRISCQELFGPAVAVTPVDSLDEALRLANDSRYGLAAGIFTRDISAALRFARQAESGNVHINWTSLWRADLMPYGGFKGSGLGKEGARYAIDEMTEMKTIIIHGLS